MLSLTTRPQARRGGHAVRVLGANRAAGAGAAPVSDTICAADAVEPTRLPRAPFPAEGSGAMEGPSLDGGRFSAATTPRKARLAELAEQVRRICRRATLDLPPCPCGLAVLDDALGGGFARAAIHELLAGCNGAAARSIALLAAAHAASQKKSILFIDTAGDFYPPAAAQLGIPLERLIIARPATRLDALWACEQALHCTALAAVIASLGRSLDTQTSRRLQLAAEAGSNLGLLIYPQNAPSQTSQRPGAAQTFAASRLSLEPLDSKGVSSKGAGSRAGSCRAGTWLNGSPSLTRSPVHQSPPLARRLRVHILKLREAQPAEPFELEIPDPGLTPPYVLDASAPPTQYDQWPPALAV